MRKFKHFMTVAILTGTMLVMNGCGNGYDFDLDKCEEVALQYLEEKYGKEFEVVNCWEARKITHSAGYAKVSVKIKGSEDDEDYLVVIYPIGNKDEDGDGYYDSYEVTSDDYIQKLYENYLKADLDDYLKNQGFENYVISVGVRQIGKKNNGKYVEGFTKEKVFEKIDIKDLLKKGEFNISYSIALCEKDYNVILESELLQLIKESLSDDECEIEVYMYDENTYHRLLDLIENKSNIWPYLSDEKIKKIKIDSNGIEKK